MLPCFSVFQCVFTMYIQRDTISVGKNSLTKTSMPTINVRTDEKLKRDATKVLSKMGLDLSRAIKMFLHQVVITESIPFEVKTADRFKPEEERALLKEMEETMALVKAGKIKTYNSAEEMTKDILKDL